MIDNGPTSRVDQIKQGYVNQSILRRKRPLGGQPLETLIERKVERNSDHRLEDRYPAEITSGPSYVTMKDSTAKVRDISASGIGLASETDRAIGDEVEVRFLNCAPMQGRVIWRKGERFGVELAPEAIEIKDDA